MNPDSTVEYNSLSWVKKQLDTVLHDAQTCLSEYVENREDPQLEQCIEHLKLVYGTLQMVEVYGAALLTEEMQTTATAIQEGRVERMEDAFDVLMCAMLQMPDYLETIQGGAEDTPIILMSLINDLRAVRNDKLLSESVLFVADTNNIELHSDGYDSEIIEAGKLKDEVKRLRTHFQLGLLDIIRNQKEIAGLQRIKAVLTALEKVSCHDEVRHLWMVAGALIEGLLLEGIDNNISIKVLLGSLDRQLKKILKNGEETFAESYSKDLLKNMLYYVSTCKAESKRVQAVKQAYQLKEISPTDIEQSDVAIGGLNADLFDTVSKGIIDDLFQVKDILEIFMHNEEQDVHQLKPAGDQLGKIADTFGMLGMGSTRQSILDQHNTITKIIDGTESPGEAVIMEVASAVLKAESDLKIFISDRSGYINQQDDKNQIVPTSEYRQVVLTVVVEALKNFAVAKEALLSYVSGIGNKEQLNLIINKLEEVQGVALMLPLGRIEDQIVRLKDYVRIALHDNQRKPDISEQDSVADVVISIEYYLEALSEGRPGVEQGLDTGDKASQILVDIYNIYTDQADTNETEEQVVATGSEDSDAFSNPESPSSIEEEVVVSAQHDDPSQEDQAEQQYEILGDNADEEIVEIFIEEAVEVLGEMHASFPLWKANHNDDESIAGIRRNFHTLKGSGRLIGAELIGEFSWKFENMLNRVIDGKISVSNDLFNIIDEALAVLPQLIEQLKGNREPISNIYDLMESADTVAEGGCPKRIDETEDDTGTESPGTAMEAEEAISIDEQKPVEIKPDDHPVIDNAQGNELVTGESQNDTIDINDVISSGILSEQDKLDQDIENIIMDNQPPDTEISFSEEEIIELKDELPSGFEIEVSAESDVDSDQTGNSEDDALLPGDALNDVMLDIEVVGSDPVGGEADLIKIEGGAETDEDKIEQDKLEQDAITEAIDITDSVEIDISEDSDQTESILNANVEQTDIDDQEQNFADEISIDESELGPYQEDEENTYVVEINEQDLSQESDNALDIDPVLLKIYYEESIGHLADVRDFLNKHHSGERQLVADRDINRAFHTLYGSARTAEVAAIAEISGAAEKYLKSIQESSEEYLDDEVVNLFDEIIASLDNMLVAVESGVNPSKDKKLLEKINKYLQHEIQLQLQSSLTDRTDAPQNMEDEAVHIDNEEGEELFSTELNPQDDSDNNHIEQNDDKQAIQKSVTEEIVSYGNIDDELIDIFLEEAEELLESCEKILQSLKDTPNSPEQIHKLQRNMHTLKGGARMAELIPVGDLTHILESLVVQISEQKREINKDLFDLLNESIDTLTGMMGDVKQRKQLVPVGDLISRIEMWMRGEVEEKRSVERFDLDLSDLKPGQNELSTQELETGAEVSEQQTVSPQGKRAADRRAVEKPHWGERATDVNFVESQELVRVRSELLNNLVNYAGEVNIYHARLGKQVSDFSFNLSELSQTVVRLKEQLRKLEIETEIQIRSGYEKEADEYDKGFDPLEMDRYSTLQQLSRSLMETAGDVESINDILLDITRDSETLLLQESRVSTDLQEGLMRTRMVRFGGLSSRMRRIVRQISRELNKDVELKIIGEDSEVDRTVLDRIVAPLEHMLRNAVAHGIELPEQRKNAGKSETGTITVTVGRQGTNVVISVKDDGRGINIEKIREKVIKQGLVNTNTPLPDHDILQYILHTGFSTADEVTQVSGRGVGMDVVDSEIKQLGGVLEIDTQAGRGTEFNIRLPLTLAINQALLVSTGEDIYAVPLASIEGVVRITGLELQRFYDSDNNHYEFNNVEYELKHLGAMLTGNQPDYSRQLKLFPVLLVHVGEQHFALHVDDLIGRREIVVKPVGMQVGAVRGIAGATILADGRVVLILEMSALVAVNSLFRVHETIETVSSFEEVKPKERLTIMVVDDSITIRKVTERILGRNGFDVILAKDGVDATNKMQDHLPDLMLLDIEMPRMDGFEVANYVRNDERLKELPIIMITSRTGTKHKEKAMEIGVNEYLGKPYQEEELMNNINSLLHLAS